ncbi:MAG: hypothetical protein IJQ76_02385 [Prevotella sp.]|nr:hypothetical protein [Prevotella sp.]
MNRRWIVWLVWLTMAVTAKAQSGLYVSQVFEGLIIPKNEMVETRVKGRMLSKYQLSFFRSLRFAVSEERIQQVRQLVDSDCRQAANSNWQQQTGKGKTTIMIQLPPKDGLNRFLCYKQHKKEVTLVYMEGRLSSIEKLKEILN